MGEFLGLGRKEWVGIAGFGTGFVVTIAGAISDGILDGNPYPPIFDEPEVVNQEASSVDALEIAGWRWTNKDYYQNGASFRREILRLGEVDRKASNDLQRYYDQLKQSRNGEQFLDGGRKFAPELGDYFYISDPSEKERGIILRHQAGAYPQEGDDKTLFDGSIVVIMGKPEDVDNQRFWPIMGYYATGIADSEAGLGDRGYVSEQYLGNKYDPNPPAGR